MKRLAFDNEKYVQMQSAKIKERIKQFDNKLYLEFGGKLFDDGLINSQFGVEVFTSGGVFSPIISGESHDTEELYRRYLAEIERVKTEGFDKSQFDMIKRSMYGEIVRGMNNPERAADYLAESYFENSDAFYEAQVLAEMTVEDCENAVREMFDPEKSSISVVDNK